MTTSSKTAVEPGLLPTFRLLTALRVALAIGVLMIGLLIPGRPLSRSDLLTLAESGVLLIYLSLPPIQKGLGRFYLPLAILISAAAPILSHYLLARPQLDGDFIAAVPYIRPVLLSPTLLIALVVVSWQYGFRSVAAFCISTAVLEFALSSWGFPMYGRALAFMISNLFSRTAIFGIVGYMITRMMAGQRRQRNELARAYRQLAQHASTVEHLGVSRERNRLAREMHDTLAHTLSGVSVQLEAVHATWDANPTKAHSLLEQALSTVRSGLGETRRALKALRASPIDDLGLGLALRQMAESASLRGRFELELDVQERFAELDPDVEQAIYRIAQEALANVVSHAQANRVSVRLKQHTNQLELCIQDNGRGFDMKSTSLIDQHFGLMGMQERAELVKGDLALSSTVGAGTCVRLILEHQE